MFGMVWGDPLLRAIGNLEAHPLAMTSRVQVSKDMMSIITKGNVGVGSILELV